MARSPSRRASPTASSGASAAPSARSRSARASRSTRWASSKGSGRTVQARRPTRLRRRPRHLRNDGDRGRRTGRLALPASSEDRTFRVQYRIRGPRGRLRRHHRRQSQGLGRRVEAAARTPDRDAHGSRSNPAGVGSPGQRARRRDDRRQSGRAAGDRHPRGSVRRAACADPAVGVHVDGRNAGAIREVRSRTSSGTSGRMRPRTSATANGSTTRWRIRYGRCSSCSRSPSCRRSPSSRSCGGSGAVSARRRTTASTSRSRPRRPSPLSFPPLLSQGGAAGSLEFTATLFDLIRRGRYKAEPVTTERKIWAGLRTQQVADLGLSLADVEAPVEAFEAPVASVVDSLVQGRPGACRWFRDRIEDDRRRTPRASRASSRPSAPRVGPWFRNDGLKALIPDRRPLRTGRRGTPLAGHRADRTLRRAGETSS